MNLRHPYLTRQLIAYIGNKRRLLPLVHRAVVSACGEQVGGLTFLDLFAGSGAVSRLARLMGFRVLSNDWEVFCRLINTAHVATDEREADGLFGGTGALDAVLEEIQAPGEPVEPWVSRYHAPASEDPWTADYRRERLFYTRANALAIDRIRERIEDRYPVDGTAERDRQRALLLAPLLYQAATHTNTSGVFKAFHKGFGGHGHDALGRILAPIRLERPVLVSSDASAQVFCEDANDLARKQRSDIAYLDPPYATHQYGSNYHMLTSIALWDRVPAPLDFDENGRLRDKAGIRTDWTRTRSAYCSREKAGAALRDLVSSLDARWILLSYSSEGLVPFDELLDISESRGRVVAQTDEYTVYPGGRQSSARRKRNVEAVLVVDTRRPASIASRRDVARDLELRATSLLLARRYAWERLVSRLGSPDGEGRVAVPAGGRSITLRRLTDGRFETPPELEELTLTELRSLGSCLEACVCRDAQEELRELVRIARVNPAPPPGLAKLLAVGLRKLAHRGNREVFAHWLRELRALATDGLEADLDVIEALAERRLRG